MLVLDDRTVGDIVVEQVYEFVCGGAQVLKVLGLFLMVLLTRKTKGRAREEEKGSYLKIVLVIALDQVDFPEVWSQT